MCIVNCKNYKVYNYNGLEPMYCNIHKLPLMIDTRPTCYECHKLGTFDGYCHTHKKKKKIIIDRSFLLHNEILMDDFVLDMSLFDEPCHLFKPFNIKVVTNYELDERIKKSIHNI